MSDERSLYDLLGVPRDADAARISKAWRRRTRKAGPGSPEFTRLNEAAETLLNPDRRAAYDATLPPVVAPEAPAASAAPEPNAAPTADRDSTSTQPATQPATLPTHTEASAPRPLPRATAITVLVALTVLAVVAVVFAVVSAQQKSTDDRTATARTEATAAARQALGVILGYSYQTMDADLQRDLQYLTPRFAATFKRNFALLTTSTGGAPSPVEQTKTVVSASVLGAGVMDASPDRVYVLVFADQTTVHKAGGNAQQCPCKLENRVKATMVKQHGTWLVDDLQTS